jgi:hypothetical protein
MKKDHYSSKSSGPPRSFGLEWETKDIVEQSHQSKIKDR